MTSLLPVITGMAAGVLVFAIFAFHFNATLPVSSSTFDSNVVRLMARINADCTNSECGTALIVKCDAGKSAIVPYGNEGRVWVIQPLSLDEVCRVMFSDLSILDLMSKGYRIYAVHECNVITEKLSDIEGRSFFELIPDGIKEYSSWCGVFVPTQSSPDDKAKR